MSRGDSGDDPKERREHCDDHKAHDQLRTSNLSNRRRLSVGNCGLADTSAPFDLTYCSSFLPCAFSQVGDVEQFRIDRLLNKRILHNDIPDAVITRRKPMTARTVLNSGINGNAGKTAFTAPPISVLISSIAATRPRLVACRISSNLRLNSST